MSDDTRARHPLFGPNRFKLGIFSANCDGGLTMSLAPERWRADWDDIVAMTRIADDAGLEFILPVAKWRGYQGKANIYGRSFETLTHGAALGALTRRIAIFSTVHVPLVTPAFAAKAIATIDHISHGRAGLNIVCGWNQAEFDLHGVTIDPDTRYDHGLEWFQIWSRLLQGGPEFDWDGRFFKLKRLQHRSGVGAAPLAGGDVGRFFSPRPRLRRARRRRAVPERHGAGPGAGAAGRRARPHGAAWPRASRCSPWATWSAARRGARPRTISNISPRQMADTDGQDYYRRTRGVTVPTAAHGSPARSRTASPAASGKHYAGAYPGSYPFVGSPDDVAAEMARMSATGLAGCTVAFVDYLKEIPYFVQEVLPRLERLGLRQPAAPPV